MRRITSTLGRRAGRLLLVWFATNLANQLILCLIIVVPIRGARRDRVLMRRIARHPELRAGFYVKGMRGQLSMLIPLVIILVGLGWSAQRLGLREPTNTVLAA